MKVVVIGQDTSNKTGKFLIEAIDLELVPETAFEELALQAIEEGNIKVKLIIKGEK